jgi:hypothetical protein
VCSYVFSLLMLLASLSSRLFFYIAFLLLSGVIHLTLFSSVNQRCAVLGISDPCPCPSESIRVSTNFKTCVRRPSALCSQYSIVNEFGPISDFRLKKNKMVSRGELICKNCWKNHLAWLDNKKIYITDTLV